MMKFKQKSKGGLYFNKIFVGKKLKLDNFWPHPTGLALLAVPYWPCMVKMFVRCKTKDLKEYFLKFWAQSMQPLTIKWRHFYPNINDWGGTKCPSYFSAQWVLWQKKTENSIYLEPILIPAYPKTKYPKLAFENCDFYP